MRPAKHATHAQRRAQEIFEIAIARLITKNEPLPIIATSEQAKITLFAWDTDNGTWQNTDINHAVIESPRNVPSITNTWNWSRRVGLTTFDETIAVVYKRAEPVLEDETPTPATLLLDTYRLDNGLPRLELRMPVPMPTFVSSSSTFPPIIRTIPETPGFELWAGVDRERRRLLIVTQSLGEDATTEGDNARLILLLGDLDRLDEQDGWTSRRLDQGGYGLDVRYTGDKMILAYRTTPHALRIPLPTVDPFFSGAPQVELGATTNSDQFYSPLRVMSLDLETLTSGTIDLPGGEHPRIQSVDPLFIVVDRPRVRIRFRLVRVGRRFEPRVDWTLRGVAKLALLLDDEERVARGVLLSFEEGDRPTFPRTSTPWIEAQDLFTQISPTGIGWASTKARFPLEPLRLDQDDKGLFFDFLHKAPLFALLESRARLNADFLQGVLTVTDLQSTVYDINHAQFGEPDRLRPDATGENAQFAPFERLSQPSGNVLTLSSYLPDNTIGGSVVTDREGIPYQFFSYLDLGDGGLRVIFDTDLGPPDAPPPIEKPKALGPERVPGPGSGDERWIELTATTWQDAGVPAIQLESLVDPLATVTSAIHSQIESLLVAGFSLANLPPIEDSGWTEDQVNSIQNALNDFMVSAGVGETVFSDDQTVPRAFISRMPEVVVAEANTIWEAGVEDETVTTVEWRFTSPTVITQSLVLAVTGNPIPVMLPFAGDWTVRANIRLEDGTVREFETVVEVEDSLFRTTTRVHRQIRHREINSVGSVGIGTATFRLLQYELQFTVEAENSAPQSVLINTLDQTDAEWQFRANGTEQGVIDYRLRIAFESSDIRLSGLLALLLNIESIRGSFFYVRSFMPGVLMNDTRSAVPLTGAEAATDNLRRGGRPLASAITTRPFGDDRMMDDTMNVQVSMLPQAVAASVITLLIGLGATAAATALIALVAALGIAIAAAAAPIVGIAGTAAVVAATVAIFLFINFVVPNLVGKAIEDNVKQALTSEDTRQSLEDARLMQFAGEGVAEAISRQVIEAAITAGAQLDPPPANTTGRDRFRQNLFQMIHVSEGLARILIRA